MSAQDLGIYAVGGWIILHVVRALLGLVRPEKVAQSSIPHVPFESLFPQEKIQEKLKSLPISLRSKKRNSGDTVQCRKPSEELTIRNGEISAAPPRPKLHAGQIWVDWWRADLTNPPAYQLLSYDPKTQECSWYCLDDPNQDEPVMTEKWELKEQVKPKIGSRFIDKKTAYGTVISFKDGVVRYQQDHQATLVRLLVDDFLKRFTIVAI